MNALILGGVGVMGSQAVPELIGSKMFERITIADMDINRAQRMAAEWGLPPASIVPLNAADGTALQKLMADRPAVVVNALPKPFAPNVARAAIATGDIRVIDLNSLSPEMRALDAEARAAAVTYVAGCGASSGLTNMMAKHGVRGLEEVQSIEISFASFRAIALSPASIEGVFWEFGPDSERGYFDNGVYHSATLWEGGKEIDFPEPFGRQTVYIVPHSEPHTLPRNLAAGRVIVQGTFTPKTMRLMHSLTAYGFFEPEPVEINGNQIGRRELIRQYLLQAPQANEEPIWGYALHVEVTGPSLRRILWTTHPDIGWAGPEAWARCVALPLVAGSLLLAAGRYTGQGVDAPEAFLPAEPFIEALRSRGIQTHETELR